MTPEIEKLLNDLEIDPHRLVTCGEVSELIRAVLAVGDVKSATTIRSLVAFVAGVIHRANIDRHASIAELSQALKGYVDGKVEGLAVSIAEVKQTTWN